VVSALLEFEVLWDFFVESSVEESLLMRFASKVYFHLLIFFNFFLKGIQVWTNAKECFSKM